MRPDASTTTPLPRRSLPRIRVDGCSLPTVVWMYTTLCRRCLTSSTEVSMEGLSDLQMIAEEFRDPVSGVGKRAGIEGDRGATAAVRLVVIAHLGQIRARLAYHVEVMVGPRIEHDARVSRSEERRVGKECRYRWSPYHEKKKKQTSVRCECRVKFEYKSSVTKPTERAN